MNYENTFLSLNYKDNRDDKGQWA